MRDVADVALCCVLLALPLAGCPTDAQQPPPVVSDVRVEAHPDNVLLATVRWTTDVPATSRVEYGPDALHYFVEDDALVTDHELRLIGLRAETDHRVQVISVDGDGLESRGEEVVHATEPMPFPTAAYHVTVHRDNRMEPGWTLSNMVMEYAVSRVVAVMHDAPGELVWYHDMGPEEGFADVEVSMVDGDHVLIGGSIPPGTRPTEVDLWGDVVWEGPLQGELGTAGSMHHSFKKLSNGNYLALVHDHEDPNEVIHDRVDEISPDLGVAVHWSSLAIPDNWDGYLQGNNVHVDEDEDALYYNSRFTSRVYKVDRTTGELLWVLGEDGDFAMTTEHDHPWFGRAHAAKPLPNGNILLYDNGPTDREFTRVAEYAVDTDAMTASLEWEYDGTVNDDPWIADALGDVDRLPNGNTLICAGTMRREDTQSRILEVDSEGAKVFEMFLAGLHAEALAGCYSVERVPVPVGEL